ncbi:MAG: PfkB family carbohydrate kinase [Oscillospiraceae bacterium]|nr:PfkB family carbohydrate kinase [Oscillospiraceae bacterium]
MHITVIGAANINIIVKSKSKIVPGDSNPANVEMKAGGTARNIAAMLAMRKIEVDFITAIGNDPFGNLLRENCTSIGINTDAWIIKSNASTGVNLATLENNGDLYAGFNAISAPESIRTAELTKHKQIIKDADLLVLDLNLSEKILALSLDLRDDRPVLVDAVSVEKVQRIENLLDRIDILKLNRLEAEELTKMTLDTKERVRQASYNLVGRGVKRAFITLGVAGVCAADEGNAIFVPALPIAIKGMKGVKGAGDAFTAGLAVSLEKEIRAQAETGVKFAAEHIERNVIRDGLSDGNRATSPKRRV